MNSVSPARSDRDEPRAHWSGGLYLSVLSLLCQMPSRKRKPHLWAHLLEHNKRQQKEAADRRANATPLADLSEEKQRERMQSLVAWYIERHSVDVKQAEEDLVSLIQMFL